MEFTVVDVLMAYNVILGQPSLNAIYTVVSTFHLKIQFLTDDGIDKVLGDQVAVRSCSVQAAKPKQVLQVYNLSPDPKSQLGDNTTH